MKVQVVRDTDCQYIKNGEELEVIIERTNFSVRCKNGEVRSYDGSRLNPIAETVEVAKPVAPRLDSLARAIFNTDSRVIKDVERGLELPEGCAEFIRHDLPKGTTVTNATFGCHAEASSDEWVVKVNDAFSKAWSSNRNNWRTEAEARAAQILAALKAGSK